jgi:predicted HAD superfamily Cof-like phosphohydrolase
MSTDLFDYYNITLETSPPKTPLQMVREFARAMGQPLDVKYLVGDDYMKAPMEMIAYTDHVEMLRTALIQEEVVEFEEADDPEYVLKELADIVYVVYGYAATFGWDLDEAVRRVHESNMSKLGPDGKPVYRADGKVMKGPLYKKPVLKDLV